MGEQDFVCFGIENQQLDYMTAPCNVESSRPYMQCTIFKNKFMGAPELLLLS